MLEHGTGVERSYPRALSIYQQAAVLGRPWALFRMTTCFEFGHGVEENMTVAAQWYQAAAESGHVESMVTLGAKLHDPYEYQQWYQGHQLPQNHAHAALLIGEAARLGNLLATRLLAEMYSSGAGVVKDKARAAELYWIVANAIPALMNGSRKPGPWEDPVEDLKIDELFSTLGELYEEGDGVTQDGAKAV